MYLNEKRKLNLHNANSKRRDTNSRMAIRTKGETDSHLKTIRVLLDTGSSGDLLFMEKGSTKCIPVVRRAIPESWVTSNGPCQTNKMGNVEISFVDYANSKRSHLIPDIVEYARNGAPSLYDQIIGKQTLHDIKAMLDFKENTITIDEILLPTRNINNLQLKPSITRTLKHNTCLAQEPASTRGATKRVVEILDSKYDKADLPGIVKDNCKHLTP